MSRDKIRLVSKSNANLFLKNTENRDGIGHDRRLGVLGQGQDLIWTIAHDARELLPQRIVNFLENLTRGGAGFGQIGTHANLLAALSGKNECAHLQRLLFALAPFSCMGGICLAASTIR